MTADDYARRDLYAQARAAGFVVMSCNRIVDLLCPRPDTSGYVWQTRCDNEREFEVLDREMNDDG